jgi:hypothetical protein
MLCWGVHARGSGKGVGQTTGLFYAGYCIRISQKSTFTSFGKYRLLFYVSIEGNEGLVVSALGSTLSS